MKMYLLIVQSFKNPRRSGIPLMVGIKRTLEANIVIFSNQSFTILVSSHVSTFHGRKPLSHLSASCNNFRRQAGRDLTVVSEKIYGTKQRRLSNDGEAGPWMAVVKRYQS